MKTILNPDQTAQIDPAAAFLALSDCRFHDKKMMIFSPEITGLQLFWLEDNGYLTHKFYQHLYGATETLITPKGEALLAALSA